MSSDFQHQSKHASYSGTSTSGWRFQPHIGIVGLESHLKLRSFTGYHPEDTLQCRTASWQTEEGISVLLSPAPGLLAPALAHHFERLASLYFLELIAKGWARSGDPIRWLQHWPARAEAPAPHDEDRFERVWMAPWALPASGTPPARSAVSTPEALAGFALESAG